MINYVTSIFFLLVAAPLVVGGFTWILFKIQTRGGGPRSDFKSSFKLHKDDDSL
jgi:hypothetical protein